ADSAEQITTVEGVIWFPRPLAAWRPVISVADEYLGDRANSPLALRRLFGRQQHAKPREATERRLERAFEAQQAPGNAFADQAPGLKAAAQRIGGEREPLHARDTQRGNEAM